MRGIPTERSNALLGLHRVHLRRSRRTHPAYGPGRLELTDYMVATAGGAPEWTSLMADAATCHCTNTGPIARIKIASTAAILGILSYYSSESLTRTLLASTPLRDVPIQPWATLTGLVATLNVRLRALDDELPGAKWRMARRTRNDDPMWHRNTQLAKLVAARVGIYGTPMATRLPTAHHAVRSDEAPPSGRAATPNIEQAGSPGHSPELRKSRLTITVTPGQTVLEALEDNGIPVESLCRAGICGACEAPVLATEPP
ncbi:2Fe-2S iron-sulfur cluster-binding protein [Nocardia nepalensis]|uniref:2Fe-2S iron-sulfur cluster-binding protein n=1 Tax=Nocardia nepalensis TaxID=3375448 RepID=UPI003B67663C